MSLPNRTLHHPAFFQALAGMEESSTAWPATAAGLVVLRLVEAWLEEGAAVAHRQTLPQCHEHPEDGARCRRSRS